MRSSRRFRVLLSAAQLLVLTALVLWLLRALLLPAALISGAEFRRLLEAGQVERVVVRGSRGTVTLREDAEGETSSPRRVGVRLRGTGAGPDPALLAQLEARGVDFRVEAPHPPTALLVDLLPVLTGTVLALWFWP